MWKLLQLWKRVSALGRQSSVAVLTTQQGKGTLDVVSRVSASVVCEEGTARRSAELRTSGAPGTGSRDVETVSTQACRRATDGT